MKTTHKTMTWIHECTHARNAVNFSSHNTRQSECGKRFLNYILRFPHDTEFLITICHMIFKHKRSGRLNVFLLLMLFCVEFTCTRIKVKNCLGRRMVWAVVMDWMLSQQNNSPEKHNRPVARANRMTTTMITSNATPTTMPMIEPRSKPLSADNGDELIRTE